MRLRLLIICAASALCYLACENKKDDAPRRIELLFLGHNSEHHPSTKPAELLSQELFNSGINIIYSNDSGDLNSETLRHYDALILYANYDSIHDSQANALLEFVSSGKGFVPVHCASYCFRNNPDIVKLIGGQFKTHGTDSFPSTFLKPAHPVLNGLDSFTTFDETYVHDKLSNDIEVLTERIDGNHHEPYTWVKTHGKGRVFYTAYGHDEQTWKNPGFMALLKSGIIWALGDEAITDLKKIALPEQQFVDARIPNYEKKDPAPKYQEPLSPGESMALIQVPPGFELKLFAAEPNIRKPISMNWDHRGRLWIIETVDYPNTVRENRAGGKDCIKICEDTDGDGTADKFTTFADGLNIPTSLVFADDGIIVSQAPYFLHLRDTDGDDKADKYDTIMRGWGTYDTHAGPSNLRYGPDNKIWGTVGYAGYKGIAENGDSIQFGQGIFTMDKKGRNLNFVSRTSNNTWGLGFSEEGDVFVSTANNTHSAFLGIPESYLNKLSEKNTGGVEKIDGHYDMHVVTKNLRQVDVHGGFTAAAGHSLYTARNFLKKYWNRIAFVNEPTGRVIHNAVLERNGSSFKEKDGWNLVASSDDWFGPVQADVGPDGNVWILDWYNFIIQHNPTPEGWENGKGNAYINPMRDTIRGRIYKLIYKGAEQKKVLTLDKSDNEQLVKALSGDNLFWRLTAQRLLVEKQDKSVVPELKKLLENSKADEIGVNAAATHALYTLHGLNAVDEKLAAAALKNPAPGVRKAAINTLPDHDATASALIESGVFNDSDLRVRLAAILKAINLPRNASLAEVIFAAARDQQNMNDQWISKALAIAAIENKNAGSESIGDLSQATDLGKPQKRIVLRTVQNVMKFEKEKIEVKAETVVEIVFDNIDFMQHNLLILQQGSLEKVGAEADKLATSADGEKINYVPRIPEVLFSTPIIDPGSKYILKFRAPEQPGKYPYICSFPGHWRIMQGVMEVKK